MTRYRSLPVIAVRRMLGNWRLLSSVIVGAVIAAAVLSSTAIYADAIRDLGLDFALGRERPADLDATVLQTTQPVDAARYERSRERVDRAVAAALGPASGGLVRMGTSATFYPTAPGEAVPARDDRPRAFLRFRSGIESHVALSGGAFPAQAPDAGVSPIPVAVGLATAARNDIAVGDRFDLHPFWAPEADPVAVEVVALLEANDAEERYWGGSDPVLDHPRHNWETFALIVPEATFFGALAQQAPGVSADFETAYAVDFDALDSRNGPEVSSALRTLERDLSDTEQRLHLSTELVRVLETYDEQLFFTRLPLFVMLLQIGGIVAYYLVMVSTMLVERQAAEIALLRSRGATTGQLLAQYGVEGLLLAALAALLGPPLAAAVISALGPTPAFDGLSGGGLLPVNVSALAYLLAAGGALLAFAALMLPAWRATRSTMVEFKRSTARPGQAPAFMRYYLDVGLVLVSALVFWQLSRQQELFAESLFGEVQADPFLLLTPAVFLLTVGIVFLRLFPLVLRGVAAAIARTRSVAVLVGIRALVRNPTHYTRLILLLMFATGVGMFGASFNATLDRSYAERAAYAVGADVRASDLRALSGEGEQAFRRAVADVPADVVSPALRIPGQLSAGAGAVGVEFLAVEPETFREVAFFREDFAEQLLEQIAATLAEDATMLTGTPIPEGTRQLGAWVKTPDLRGPANVGLWVRDADERYEAVMLGEIAPGAPDGAETEPWRFLSADIGGGEAGLVEPLSLHGYFLELRSGVARAAGTVLLGPVLATAELPPAGAATDRPPGDGAFPGAAVVHDFATIAGFELIEGLTPTDTGDVAVAEVDAPPGFGGSTRFQWSASGRRQAQVRGLQQATDHRPVTFYLQRGAAAELELLPGDRATLAVGQRYTIGELAGVFDYFPTADAERRGETLAVVDLSRLLALLNAAPTSRPAGPDEVWYAAAEPAAVRDALAQPRFDARLVVDVETERLRQQEDPLVAAGWHGVLAIAFGAVLLLSAIGFLVYSYLTAQQRALEFAILRTLGFSRSQVFSLVAFEHVFVIVAGMGLGTIVGLQVGRLMMDFLAVDERGREVLPPFVLGVSWPSVFAAWGILGTVFVTTIGVVVLLYLRLAVHRALRIGDA